MNDHLNTSISAIIPVYNQAEFILEAIDSILKQSDSIEEIIVVDDGSTDNLKEALANFKGTYIRQNNQGVSSARNRGVVEAKGEWIAFLDADDTWPKERTKDLLKGLRNHPQAQVIVGTSKVGTERQWLPSFGATLFHRSVFDQVGLINGKLKYSEDQDWFLRAKEQNIALVAIPEVSQALRIHPGSATFNKTWSQVGIHNVLKMSLDRRRKQTGGRPTKLETLSSYVRPL